MLCWLPDLNGWADLISSFLKPGGVFYMAEFHPVSYIFGPENGELKICDSYFNTETRRYESEVTYTGDGDRLAHPVTYQWQHTLSDIVGALIGAGLRLGFLHEFPFTVYDMYPGLMKRDEQGRWWLAGDHHPPLLFSVTARKV